MDEVIEEIEAIVASGTRVNINYYIDDIIRAPFHYKNGRVYRPTGPGLGIDVDEDKIAGYAI